MAPQTRGQKRGRAAARNALSQLTASRMSKSTGPPPGTQATGDLEQLTLAALPQISSTNFLNLPLEIRRTTYRYYVLPSERKASSNPRDASSLPDWNHNNVHLLSVCRQVNAEYWPIFTANHTFAFEKPRQFGNEFLSVLPKQRLYAVRHVTLIGGENLVEFQRLWWYYLDFFARLDTFSIDLGRKKAGTHELLINIVADTTEPTEAAVYLAADLLMSMLEQGGTRKPSYSWKSRTHVTTTDAELPETHNWLLHIACLGMNVWKNRHSPYRAVKTFFGYRLVVRRQPENTPDAGTQYGYDDVFQSWASLARACIEGRHVQYMWCSSERVRLVQCDDWVMLQPRRRDTFIFARDRSRRTNRYVRIRTGTRVLTPFSTVDNDASPVDVVTFGGKWIKHD